MLSVYGDRFVIIFFTSSAWLFFSRVSWLFCFDVPALIAPTLIALYELTAHWLSLAWWACTLFQYFPSPKKQHSQKKHGRNAYYLQQILLHAYCVFFILFLKKKVFNNNLRLCGKSYLVMHHAQYSNCDKIHLWYTYAIANSQYILSRQTKGDFEKKTFRVVK